MSNIQPSSAQQGKRAKAVKTAWILGIIAFAIFAAFIGAAVTGH